MLSISISYYKGNVAPNIYAMLIPVLIIMLAGLALGFGIIISSMTTIVP